MQLDTRSLILACGIVSALLGLVAFFYARQRPNAQALKVWAGCGILNAFGYLFVALRGTVPDFASFVLANALVTAALVVAYQSLRLFRGHAGFDGLGWALVLVVGAGVWANLAYAPNLGLRIAFISAVQAFLLARLVYELRVHAHPDCLPAYRFTELVFLVALVAMVLRGLAGAASQGPGGDFLAPNWRHAVPFLVFIGVIAAATLGAFWIDTLHRQRELVYSARHDELTGLLNRHAFLDAAGRELSRVERTAGVFSLAIFDLDRFKRVNDEHGHPVGDEVLRAFARILEKNIRKHDIVGRYGGEEFALLMPDSDTEMALRVAERIRTDLASKEIEVGRVRVRITVSGGIATFGADGRSWDEIVSAADQALYRAKEAGRDRVLTSGVLTAGGASSSGTGAGSTPGRG